MQSVFAQRSHENIPVVIVDDARFTLEMLRRTLKQAGFLDIRTAGTAGEALAILRERSAGILLADWLMPEMDGLDLTREVRQLEASGDHYTYIILLTGSDKSESLSLAFAEGVDDFVNKSPDNEELLARIHAAGRITRLQNDLIQANRRLLELNRQLDERAGLQPGSRLGNQPFLMTQLDNLLRHLRGRGGSLCVALVQMQGYPAIADEHGMDIAAQMLDTIGERLEQTSRPVDVVARLEGARFVLVMQQADEEPVPPGAFRRIHQALNLRAYKTGAGFLTADCAIAVTHVVSSHLEDELTAQALLDYTECRIGDARDAGRPLMTSWQRETTQSDQ